MYIVIAGGGLVGRGLARKLISNRHDVVVIDRDREVCEYLYSKLGAVAINGSATSIEVLEDASIKKADVAVSLMRHDADNLAFCVLAKYFEVPRVIVRMRNSKYEPSYRMAGAAATISITDTFARELALEVEHPDIEQVASLGRGKASLVIAQIPKDSPVEGKTITEITKKRRFPDNCVIAGIFRSETEEFVFPRGSVALRVGDRVFLAATTEDVQKAAECLGVKKS